MERGEEEMQGKKGKESYRERKKGEKRGREGKGKRREL